MADKMSIDKNDPGRDESGDESTGSSHDAEPQTNTTSSTTTQENQQPKRKGGRKPIYATSEERKQRNRQAQAAFRERRTEYIKQLEETIRVHESNLHNLQTAHRHAADECLMLRYKNSLLERILLEKGIDVQAELRAKTGSPNLGPTHMPQNMVQPPPLSRSLMRHHHSRRSNSSIAPKVEPGVPLASLPAPLISPHIHATRPSPKNQPTPPSIATSPTGTATGSHGSQYAPSPATSGSDMMNGQGQVRHRMKAPPIPPPSNMSNPLARHMHMAGPPQHPQHQQQQQQQQQQQRPSRPSVGAPAPFYAAQAYQNHIEQLDSSIGVEQEYDAAADMMEDPVDPPDTPSGPGPYPGAPYGGEPQPMSLPSPVTTMPPNGHGHAGQHGHTTSMDGVQHEHQTHHQQQQHQQQHDPRQQQHQQQQGNYPSMTQLLDPNLDFGDPFGLSASMQFPTQFSFDTSNMR